jgi:serine/threonine-protein kinase/endoribonuclease IRE1
MFYISTLIFTLLLSAACFAEIVSLRSRAVVERPKSPNDFRFLPPIASSTNTAGSDELELLDIVLMASVDGKFHALNRTSGRTLWSMSPSVSVSTSPGPSSLAPLVRSDHVITDPDLTDDESANQELYIIEPQSGDIFVMASPDSPLHRLPFSMSQLVDMSPFSFSGDEDRRVFVGKKETSLVLLELETGKVKATLNSECPWDPYEDLRASAVDELDLDELDGTKPPKEISMPSEVFIGRTGEWLIQTTFPVSIA